MTPEAARRLDDATGETWRPVVGYEDRYDVSDQGRVRSLRRRNKVMDRLRREPLILSATPLPSNGYVLVALCGAGRLVHRLVLEAFVGPCPDGYQAAHLNGVRVDNRLENLAWKTPKENARDKDVHGTTVRGERQRAAKLTESAVRAIRDAAARGENQHRLAERYGVHQRAVWAVIHRRAWAGVR